MSAPPPYPSQQYQYPPQQNYGGPGCYPPQPQQPCYPHQPQPNFGYGYGQSPPIMQTSGQPRSSGDSASKCCLWTLLGLCCGCCLAECCD